MVYQRASLAEANHSASTTELLVRFALWAAALQSPPLPEQIAARFGVSAATAYRWRNAYHDARGIPRPEPRAPRGDSGWSEAVKAARRRASADHYKRHRREHPNTLSEKTDP